MTCSAGGMMQLSLFRYPDEEPLFRALAQSRSDKWDHWWLAMLRGPRSFPDEDEEHLDGHGRDDAVQRQASFADFS
jgi:hypothetical protein